MSIEQDLLQHWKKIAALGVVSVLAFNTLYTVQEGHIGITKRFGEAKAQVQPGLHSKIPFIDSIEEMEVRTRKNDEMMASSTAEQMPIQVKVSVNWTLDRAYGLELYQNYGGLTQFEARILDPRFRSAVKSSLPKFTAEQLIQNRNQAIALIEENLGEEMKGFPVKMDSIQIENLILPKKYIASIETKQTEKNLAAAEEHKLARQALEAQREVNTAHAKRDAAKAKADGEAYATEVNAKADAAAIALKGEAEAKAIKAKSAALKNNPLLVQLIHEQQWDGKLPQTVMGDNQSVLWNMSGK